VRGFPSPSFFRRDRMSLKRREARLGWGLVSIYLLYTAIFWGYPFVWMLILAFSRWKFVGSPKFVGLQNFFRIFEDKIFWRVFLNTMNFLSYFIPMVFIASILFAIALNRMKYFKTFVTLSFLVAYVSSGVAYSIMFQRIFSETGPINRFLYNAFGITIPWFTDPQLAMLTIAIMVTWKFVGYYGLILYSGLQAIPKSIFEAAELDGATSWVKFWKITLPLLNPAIVTVLILAVNLSFGIFTEPYMITGGGPMNRTLTFMLYMYNTAFQRINPSYATTIAIMTALINFSIVIFIRKVIEKEVTVV